MMSPLVFLSPPAAGRARLAALALLAGGVDGDDVCELWPIF